MALICTCMYVSMQYRPHHVAKRKNCITHSALLQGETMCGLTVTKQGELLSLLYLTLNLRPSVSI